MNATTLRAQADALDIIASHITEETSLGELECWLHWAGIPRREWMATIQDGPIADATVALIQGRAEGLRRAARVEDESEAA